MQELHIDPEFEALIPPLTDAEREQLEQNLLADGVRDPIVTWANHDDTILDGHNRYAICQRHQLPFKTKALRFESREAALAWIAANQLGRRNLTPRQISYLRGRRYQSEKQSHGGHRSDDGASGQNTHLKTDERLAEEYQVDPKTIRRDAEFAESLDAAPPEVKRAVLAGEVKATKASVAKLAKLPKAKQETAAKKIAAGTASSVQQAIDTTDSESGDGAVDPGDPSCDRFGVEIPDPALPALEANRRFGQFIRQTAKLLREMESLEYEPAGAYVSWARFRQDSGNLLTMLRGSVFHSLCPHCQGNACEHCKQTGWITQSVYNNLPHELRNE